MGGWDSKSTRRKEEGRSDKKGRQGRRTRREKRVQKNDGEAIEDERETGGRAKKEGGGRGKE